MTNDVISMFIVADVISNNKIISKDTFRLDTGSPVSMLTDSLLYKKADTLHYGIWTDAAGLKKKLYENKDIKISIGDIIINEQSVYISPVETCAEEQNNLIGMDILQHCNFVFDYVHRKFYIEKNVVK